MMSNEEWGFSGIVVGVMDSEGMGRYFEGL